MNQLRRAIAPVLILGAAVAAFTASSSDTRAAAAPVGDAAGVTMLAGSQLAVVVPTFHNGQHANVTTVTVGTAVHVRVTVAGAFGTPTGSVFGAIYANGTCSGGAVDLANPGFLDGGALDMTSLAWTPTASGKLSVSVHYDGDDTYAARTSACTAIDVTKATPSIGMKVHNGSHSVVTSLGYGGTVHPYVTINSRVGTPTGLFTVSWWKNDTCSGAKADQSISIGIGQGGNTDATPFTKSAAPVGKYAFRVHYNGDAGFKAGDSACVPYTVTKLVPGFVATVHDFHHMSPTEVPVDAQVHPFVSVTGPDGLPSPDGDVSIDWYLGGGCQDLGGTYIRPAAASMELLDLATSRPSPGAMSWRVIYPGDAVYTSEVWGCISRTWKAPSSLDLDIHDGSHAAITTAVTGTEIHFRVQATGAFGAPTGVVGIRAFDNGTCSGAGTTIAMSPLSGGVGHDTVHRFILDQAGTFSYRAEYHGDLSYFPATACATVKVTPAAPAPTPTAKATAKPAATPAAGSTAAPAATDLPAGASADPGASGAPAATDDPASTTAPDSTGGLSAPGASSMPAASSNANPGAGAGGSGMPTSPSGDAGLGSGWMLLLLLLVVLVVFGAGIAFGRRRNQPAAEA